MDEITVRFIEQSGYDVMRDAVMTRFQAITPYGSFWQERACEAGKSKREARQQFQEYVLQAIDLGQMPHEVAVLND